MQDNSNLDANNNSLLYVNISSSVLRNKFEKNRISHLQNIAEKSNNFNIKKNEEIEILKKITAENDNKINEILMESTIIENKINMLTDSLNEKNHTIMTAIYELRCKFSDFLLKSQYVDYSDHIKMIKTSVDDLKNQLQNFSLSPEDPNFKMVNASVDDVKNKLQDLSRRLEDKNDDVLYQSIDNIKSELNDIMIKVRETSTLDKFSTIEEKMESFSKSFYEERSQMDNILKLVIDNILPKDFLWESYRDINQDLQHYTEFELKKHYLTYGVNENREYLLENKTLPVDFVWKEYLQMNIDIAGLLTCKSQAENHYLKHGIKDKRMFKMSQLDEINYFVYSGRKSGSSTLTNSFLNLENALSIQIHNNEDFLYKYGQCKYNSIFDLVDNNMKTQKKIFIFDSYRTPIEKKISSFFEDIDKYIPMYKECDISYLITYFNKKYIYGKNCSNIYTEDYEPLDEIMEYYKLPPITNFDFEKKYVVIQHKNLIFVKIRFNEINQWDNILTKIIGKSVIIKDKNKSETKPYIDVYNNFKNQYRIPKEFLEKLKTDARFVTYNSKTERIKYIKDWYSKIE
jgi:hypothetical protein